VISFLNIFFLWLFSCQPLVELIYDMPFYSTCAVLFFPPLSVNDDKKIKGYSRVGPHNKDIVSIIFGSLLGKGSVERKKDGSRITFYQEAVHIKYLLFLYNQLASAGYCKPTLPQIGKTLGKKGKIYKTIKFAT
jgi:hypothetical protein